MGCVKEVSNLINHPVVNLLGTRVGGTSAEVVTKRVYLKLPATTIRERHFRKERDLGSHGGGKEGLPETSRPGLISTMRPDLPQPTHRLEHKTRLGESSASDYKFSISVRNTESPTVVDAMLRAQAKLLGTAGHGKCLLKVFERPKVV